MTTETEDLELLRGLLEDGLISTLSSGNPDPAQQRARYQVEFFGEGALEKAHRLQDALPSLLSRTQAAEKALEEAGKALEAVQRIAGEGALHPSDVNHLRKTIMAMSSTATIALHRLGTPS